MRRTLMQVGIGLLAVVVGVAGCVGCAYLARPGRDEYDACRSAAILAVTTMRLEDGLFDVVAEWLSGKATRDDVVRMEWSARVARNMFEEEAAVCLK